MVFAALFRHGRTGVHISYPPRTGGLLTHLMFLPHVPTVMRALRLRRTQAKDSTGLVGHECPK
eukprot:scaffold21639_cov32-Phaeocystis_antarctica.AAC.1